MDVGFVKRQIKNRNLDNFYIFTGDEYKVQEIYINKISEVTNKPIFRINNISSLLNRGKSLFRNSKLYVVRDDIDFIKTEKYWGEVEDSLRDDILILLVTDIDKRTKFYKQWESKIVTFDIMSDDLILKYTSKAIGLNRDNIFKLADICEGNYGRILIEVDKILNYMNSKSIKDCNKAFNLLLEQGTIYIPPQDAIFNFVDEVLLRHPYKAYDLLDECIRIGEPSLRLITVLYTNFKNLLQVQECRDRNVQDITGLSWWEIKNAQSKLNCWTSEELIYIVNLLRRIERGIKIGTIEESFVMDYFMVNIF